MTKSRQKSETVEPQSSWKIGGLRQTDEMPVTGILRQLGFDGKSGLIAPKWTPILRRPNYGRPAPKRARECHFISSSIV